MREIRFRAWDVTNKIMLHELDDNQLNDERSFGGHYMTVLSYGQLTINWIDKHDDWHDCIPLQSTGLHDKNGKEIYEGDILSGFNGGVFIKVEFVFAGWHFSALPSSKFISYPSAYSNAGRMEIIGNIYENPELVEE